MIGLSVAQWVFLIARNVDRRQLRKSRGNKWLEPSGHRIGRMKKIVDLIDQGPRNVVAFLSDRRYFSIGKYEGERTSEHEKFADLEVEFTLLRIFTEKKKEISEKFVK